MSKAEFLSAPIKALDALAVLQILAVESDAAGIQGGGDDQSIVEAVAVAGLDADATL